MERWKHPYLSDEEWNKFTSQLKQLKDWQKEAKELGTEVTLESVLGKKWATDRFKLFVYDAGFISLMDQWSIKKEGSLATVPVAQMLVGTYVLSDHLSKTRKDLASLEQKKVLSPECVNYLHQVILTPEDANPLITYFTTLVEETKDEHNSYLPLSEILLHAASVSFENFIAATHCTSAEAKQYQRVEGIVNGFVDCGGVEDLQKTFSSEELPSVAFKFITNGLKAAGILEKEWDSTQKVYPGVSPTAYFHRLLQDKKVKHSKGSITIDSSFTETMLDDFLNAMILEYQGKTYEQMRNAAATEVDRNKKRWGEDNSSYAAALFSEAILMRNEEKVKEFQLNPPY